ncbi:hypothetical protein TRAPUB_13238 [Trametes pubescens]|uniref:Uncharacterized protein n=1 Tax=Trametes pubescens TaxID=154538 RepID=A0A1M2VRM9_TRAPU|nr:hypothetical protein TRAPUB_13238 [Trametes pubescens]
MRTRPFSLVSDSSRGARYGSATNPEPSSSSRPPTLRMSVDHKRGGYHKQELPGPPPPLPVLPAAEYLPDRSESLPAVSQDVAATAPELVTAAGAHEERLLHLALPWAFGQRVLAMMAGYSEDARSMDSSGSEPLPAYEPRG